MKYFKKILDFLANIYKTLIVSFTFLLFVIVAYNVIRRYVFNNSVAWADELSRFVFIWVNLLGMISVFQNDELIKLDIVSRIISRKKAGKYFLIIVEFSVISVVLVLLTYYSFQFLAVMNHVSATLAIPMKIVYSVLPFSMSCMLLGNIAKFIKMINNGRS